MRFVEYYNEELLGTVSIKKMLERNIDKLEIVRLKRGLVYEITDSVIKRDTQI